jgi:lysophospholipase L1-like esterase
LTRTVSFFYPAIITPALYYGRLIKNPVYGWDYLKNITFVNDAGNQVRINNYSYRGLDINLDEAKRTILILGGSDIFGSCVSECCTLSSDMQKELDMRFPGRFRVVNGGFEGFSSFQMLYVLKRSLFLKPEMVIAFYGGNDWGGGRQVYRKNFNPKDSNLPVDFEIKIQELLWKSYTYKMIYSARTKLFRTGISDKKPDLNSDRCSKKKMPRVTKEGYMKNLVAMEEMVESKGINLVLGSISQPEPYKGLCSQFCIEKSIPYIDTDIYIQEDLKNHLQEFEQCKSLEYRKSTENFFKIFQLVFDENMLKLRSSSYYFCDGTHPSAVGYEVIARELVSDIVDKFQTQFLTSQ